MQIGVKRKLKYFQCPKCFACEELEFEGLYLQGEIDHNGNIRQGKWVQTEKGIEHKCELLFNKG